MVRALLRSGASAGDLVVISGTPGLAALALVQIRGDEAVDRAAWREFTRPEPRLELGRVLRGKHLPVLISPKDWRLI